MIPCMYRQGDTERVSKSAGGQKIHHCFIHEECVPGRGSSRIVGCEQCKDRLVLEDSEFATKWRDPLFITNRRKEPIGEGLRDLLAGRSAFLVCGGPSANDLPLEDLNRRGVFTFTVNNVAGHSRFRPNAFVCSDPPMKFHDSIWLDPAIMKFIPTPKLNRGRQRNKLRYKENGSFKDLDVTTNQCPNVWAFKRRSWMAPDDTFFTTDDASWGNQNVGVKRTGERKTACTMLCALRILRYLGASKIFLVGVDFKMSPFYGYSFNQARTVDASSSNNEHFEIVNDWLCRMEQQGCFKRFGLEIYNCFAESGLRAFPYVPFEEALKIVRGRVVDEPDLSYWYEKVEEVPKG